ncbi:MAG: hypothetical protein FD129_3224, partial [bacterium]
PAATGSKSPTPTPGESPPVEATPGALPIDHPTIQKALELFDGEITP